MATQITAQPHQTVPAIPVTPPSFQGDSTFWTIVAIAILVKVIVGNPHTTKPRK